MDSKAFRVTHRSLKWEYPYIFAPSAEAAILNVIDGLDKEKRSKDLFRFRNWTAAEMVTIPSAQLTVGELIEQLSQMPHSYPVELRDGSVTGARESGGTVYLEVGE